MHALKPDPTHAASLTDGDVVRRVLAGEKAFYEILMRRHNQRVYRAVRSYITDTDDVQDVMQEAYVKAYTNLEKYRHEAAFSTWLVRIAINEALQRLKRIRRTRTHVDPDLRSDDLLQLPDTSMKDPEQHRIQRESGAQLERAVDSLPEAYRTVYMLREVEEMSVHEVSAALNISESNVKVRLHRAKALLKEALYEQHVGSAAFPFGNAHCDRLVAAVMARI